MAQQPSQHIQNSTRNVQAQSAHLNSLSIASIVLLSLLLLIFYSHRTICLSNISLFSKSIKIQMDSSLGWTLVLDPLSCLHGVPLKTGEPRRSRAISLQLTGYWGIDNSSYNASHGCRRTADRVINFFFRTQNSTYNLLLTSHTYTRVQRNNKT